MSKTALITCIDRYMGIPIKKKFESLGYEVIEGLDLSAGAVYHEVLGVWPAVGARWR